MRTAIFLGLTAIADAIRYDWLRTELAGTIGIIFVILMLMDIFDFIENHFNKNK